MDFVAKYNICVESDEELRERLGIVYTDAGPVQVGTTAKQLGEVCEVTLTGSLPAIVAWMATDALDSEGLLHDVANMINEGDIKPA